MQPHSAATLGGDLISLPCPLRSNHRRQRRRDRAPPTPTNGSIHTGTPHETEPVSGRKKLIARRSRGLLRPRPSQRLFVERRQRLESKQVVAQTRRIVERRQRLESKLVVALQMIRQVQNQRKKRPTEKVSHLRRAPRGDCASKRVAMSHPHLHRNLPFLRAWFCGGSNSTRRACPGWRLLHRCRRVGNVARSARPDDISFRSNRGIGYRAKHETTHRRAFPTRTARAVTRGQSGKPRDGLQTSLIAPIPPYPLLLKRFP